MLHSQIDIDQMFDLDLALTMPDYSAAADEELTAKPEADAQSMEAARRLVDAMPEVIAGVNSQCIVCLERFRSAESGRRIPCGHVFHQGCILEWLSVQNCCPLCRGKIPL